MKRFVGGAWVLALFGVVASPACVTSQTQASSVICTPSQLVRCNNCTKPAEDPRVYRGWIQCSADGESLVGACENCEPDTTAGGDASAGNSGNQGTQGAFEGGAGGGGDTGGGTIPPTEPVSLIIAGTLDQLGNVVSNASLDGSTVATSLTGSSSMLAYDTIPTEGLNASAAQSVTLSPDLGACEGTVTFSLTLETATFDFEGSDIVPATDCADYAASVHTSGIQAVFVNVPYASGDATASQATLTLTP